MSRDPYGYRETIPKDDRDATGPKTVLDVAAGLSTLLWLGSSVVCCGACSGVLGFYERKPGDTWMDDVGVWLILTALAWPLASIALWTGALHGLARRWWTSAGPNVVLGGVSGCAAWLVVFLAWVVLIVIVQGG